MIDADDGRKPFPKAVAAEGHADAPPRLDTLRHRLRILYHGQSKAAQRFQLIVIVVDLLTIAFFIATPCCARRRRFSGSTTPLRRCSPPTSRRAASPAGRSGAGLMQPTVIVDLVILATLLAPYWLINYGFLRILRLWSVSRAASCGSRCAATG